MSSASGKVPPPNPAPPAARVEFQRLDDGATVSWNNPAGARLTIDLSSSFTLPGNIFNGLTDVFRLRDYPEGWSMPSSIRVDDTILPDCAVEDDKDFGLFLRPGSFSVEALSDELQSLVVPLVWSFRVATEVSPGTIESVGIREIANAHRLAEFLVSAIGQRA